MQGETVQRSEHIYSTGKRYLQKAGRFAGRMLLNLIKPYLPYIILIAGVFLLLLIVSTVLFAQLTAEPEGVRTTDGEPLETYLAQAVEKANNRTQYDTYGRDIMLELTDGHVWALITIRNSIGTFELSKENIDRMVNELKPMFKYTTHQRVIEERVPFTDPDTGEPVIGADGEPVMIWKVTDTVPETLLVSADTLIGKYEYSYKKTTETNGDIRITYMQPYETKLIGKPYERLERYIVETLKIPESETELTIQAVLESSNGYEWREERMAWLLSSRTSWNVNYTGIPPEIIPVIQEASQKYGIPEWLIAGIIEIESSFNPLARNINSGAYGLMQIMPFHIEGGLYERLGFSRTADRDNPRAQIIAGTHILYNHIARYISPAEVDWYTDMWKQQTLLGIINYGGYPNKRVAEGQAKYASVVWAAADTYKLSGVKTHVTWPVPGNTRISSYFGTRTDPIHGSQSFHNGIDIPAKPGTPIISVTSGKVVYSGWAGGYGNMVVIESGRYQFLYAHNSRNLVRTGQQVVQGQKIAEIGSTGRSTGPHLHFAVSIGNYGNGKFINPLTLVTPR